MVGIKVESMGKQGLKATNLFLQITAGCQSKTFYIFGLDFLPSVASQPTLQAYEPHLFIHSFKP